MFSILLALTAHAGDPAIDAHLLQVVATLRAETPSDLPPDVRARRHDALDLLSSYVHAGDYPEHHAPTPIRPRDALPPRMFQGGGGRTPVFVDAEGTHCAVGYLMAVDAPELVDRIVEADNYGYLLDMRVDGVAGWAAEHGFTPEELAWIQPSYASTLDDCVSYAVPPPVPWAVPTPCTGPDAGFNSASYRITGCQECGGGYQVYVFAVSNGSVDANDVTVRIIDGSTDQILVEQGEHTVPAGGSVVLGPFDIGDFFALGSEGIQVELEVQGDCDASNDSTGAYDDDYWTYHPAECDTGAPSGSGETGWPDTGATGNGGTGTAPGGTGTTPPMDTGAPDEGTGGTHDSDDAGEDRTGDRGCTCGTHSSSPSGLGALAFLGLVTLRRRARAGGRQARPVPPRHAGGGGATPHGAAGVDGDAPAMPTVR